MIARSSFAWSSCHCARLLHSCAITHGIQLIVSLHHYAIIPIAANEFRIISMWNFIHYISGSEHSEEKTRKCQQQLPFSNGEKIIRQECNGMRFIRWHVYFPFCVPLALWTHQYLFSIFYASRTNGWERVLLLPTNRYWESKNKNNTEKISQCSLTFCCCEQNVTHINCQSILHDGVINVHSHENSERMLVCECVIYRFEVCTTRWNGRWRVARDRISPAQPCITLLSMCCNISVHNSPSTEHAQHPSI